MATTSFRLHPARQCNKLQLIVHTEHKAIIIVSVTSTVCCKVNSASTVESSNLADQDFRDKNRLFVYTILLHVCPAVAPRRGRVSAIFYACMELQTLILAIGKVNTNLGDEAFSSDAIKHIHLRALHFWYRRSTDCYT